MIDYINKLPNTNLVSTKNASQLKEWLKHKQYLLKNTLNNYNRFIDFVISIKNEIHRINKEPQTTKAEVFAMFNITVTR